MHREGTREGGAPEPGGGARRRRDGSGARRETTERLASAGAFDILDPVERDSTPSIVAGRIRDAITEGSFPAGMQLSEAHIAERLGVSRGPVREALQRLIQEGLLRAVRHRGVFVIELGIGDVRDVYLARAAVERTAVGVLVRRADQPAFAALGERLADLERATQSADWSSVAGLDLRFHETLVAATGSKRLARMFRTLMAETRMCLTGLESGYAVWEDLAAEHGAILAAMREGDEALALRRLDAHFELAVRDLEARDAEPRGAVPPGAGRPAA